MYRQFITIVFLFSALFVKAQVLKNTNLNLNPGGAIYDVAYDSFYDAYIVVGKFTTINGQARNNLAFINANTFAVMPYAPITSINGEIRSVEVARDYPNTYSYIYIGGNFTTVNGQSRVYCARFRALTDGGVVPYSINTWNIQLQPAGYQSLGYDYDGVHDIRNIGDSLFVVGSFYLNNPTYTPSYDAKNIGVFNAIGLNVQHIQIFNDIGELYYLEPLLRLEKFGADIYLTGYNGAGVGYVKKYTSNGLPVVWNIIYHTFDGSSARGVTGMQKFDNTSPPSFFLTHDVKLNIYSPQGRFFAQTGGDTLALPNTQFSQYGYSYGFFHRSYKNYLFSAGLARLSSMRVNANNTITPDLASFTLLPSATSWYAAGTLESAMYNRLHNSRNKIFLSGENLTTVAGQPRTGLAVFCLEPLDAKNFTVFDTLVCEEEQEIYTIPAADFADGYRWTYTGTNATYRVAGTTGSFLPLSSVHLTGNTGKSIEVRYPVGATNGTLTVTPFSTCNTTTDYMYALGKSLNITVTPLPVIIAPDSLALNCYTDTVHFVIQSPTPGVDFYEWTYNNGGNIVTNDSLLVTASNPVIFQGYYYAEIGNTVMGCYSHDSTYFSVDTIPPSINSPFSNPSVFSCSTDSMVLYANVPGAISEWATVQNPTNFMPDPLTIYSMDSLDFIIHAIKISNGCEATNTYQVSIDTASVQGTISGYPSFGSTIILDTISCSTSGLSLTCIPAGSNAGFGSAEWLVNAVPSGTNLLNLTTADSLGMDPNTHTKTYSFRTVHSGSGCENNYDVTILFDFDIPTVIPFSGSPSINCSQSSVLLQHPQTGVNTTEGWLVGGISNGSSDLTVTTSGDYIYEVVSTINGCSNFDTITVVQNTAILFNGLPSDTLICDGASISLTAGPIGLSETPIYAWSNGNTSATSNFTGGIDTIAIVSVSTLSGCNGSDTVLINIPDPVSVNISSAAGCADVVLQLSNISGGTGNYTYSLDNINYQSSPSFTGLTIGTQDVYVKDDLGCVYTFTEEILPGTGGLDINFLISTYNAVGDTVQAVNITDFTGFDSLLWTLPIGATWISEDDTMIVFSMGTDGWFNVDLTAYLDTCHYTFSKPVYFGTEKPNFDDQTSSNGILNFNLFENPTTDGNFHVDATFGVAQDYAIFVTNIQGQSIPQMTSSGNGTEISLDFEFPIGTVGGNYVLHLISDFDARQTVIIYLP